MPASCWLGNSLATRKMFKAAHLSGRRAAVLDKALAAAGIDRKDVYVTNIVKHFKWEPRGKRRLHKKPQCAGDQRLPSLA